MSYIFFDLDVSPHKCNAHIYSFVLNAVKKLYVWGASIEIYLNRCFRMFYVYITVSRRTLSEKLTLRNFFYETILKQLYVMCVFYS